MTQTPELDPAAGVERHPRCATHGLRYDPRVQGGCVLCRRTAAAPVVAPQNVTPTPVAALVALCMSAGVFAHVLSGGRLLDGELRALVAGAALSRRANAASQDPGARPTPLGTTEQAERAAVPQSASTLPIEEDACTRAARGGDASLPQERWPHAGLHAAAARGDLARIVQESDLGFSKDTPDAQGRTPLAWAILAGQRESARVLLDEGANPNVAAADGDTPLMLAARAGLSDMITRLLVAGARPRATNQHGQTALMVAARYGRAEAIRALAPDRGQLGMRCDREMTAIHHAAGGLGCPQVLPSLLATEGAVELRDGRGATAFLIAVGEGHAQFARALLERGADPSARDYAGLGAFDRLVAPREAPSAAQLQALREVFALLAASRADRRLMLDPSTTPILFRRELDELARREGRPLLPAYSPLATPVAMTVQSGAARPLRLFSAVPQRSSATLPRWQPRDILLRHRGWSHVPNIVQQVVVRGLSPRKGQRVRLSGDAQAIKSWKVDDVLLIQQMSGTRVVASAFLGTVDEVLVGEQPVRRLGARGGSFAPHPLDFGTWLATDAGADRVLISVLDYGGWAELSDVYLTLEGPLAHETLARMSVQAVTPNGAAP